jgi:hypothetical protein
MKENIKEVLNVVKWFNGRKPTRFTHFKYPTNFTGKFVSETPLDQSSI